MFCIPKRMDPQCETNIRNPRKTPKSDGTMGVGQQDSLQREGPCNYFFIIYLMLCDSL